MKLQYRTIIQETMQKEMIQCRQCSKKFDQNIIHKHQVACLFNRDFQRQDKYKDKQNNSDKKIKLQEQMKPQQIQKKILRIKSLENLWKDTTRYRFPNQKTQTNKVMENPIIIPRNQRTQQQPNPQLLQSHKNKPQFLKEGRKNQLQLQSNNKSQAPLTNAFANSLKLQKKNELIINPNLNNISHSSNSKPQKLLEISQLENNNNHLRFQEKSQKKEKKSQKPEKKSDQVKQKEFDQVQTSSQEKDYVIKQQGTDEVQNLEEKNEELKKVEQKDKSQMRQHQSKTQIQKKESQTQPQSSVELKERKEPQKRPQQIRQEQQQASRGAGRLQNLFGQQSNNSRQQTQAQRNRRTRREMINYSIQLYRQRSVSINHTGTYIPPRPRIPPTNNRANIPFSHALRPVVFVAPHEQPLDKVTESGLKRIPRVNYVPTQEETHTLCAICYENFIPDEVLMKLPVCNHMYHGACISQWFKLKNKCPYCMQKHKDSALNHQ